MANSEYKVEIECDRSKRPFVEAIYRAFGFKEKAASTLNDGRIIRVSSDKPDKVLDLVGRLIKEEIFRVSIYMPSQTEKDSGLRMTEREGYKLTHISRGLRDTFREMDNVEFDTLHSNERW
ncbi:MAG: hypothetical protein Q8N88_03025 [Nanoarchaeota archaeon]|nr:hypothetical protein [Nanoarchaeota archaeon]